MYEVLKVLRIFQSSPCVQTFHPSKRHPQLFKSIGFPIFLQCWNAFNTGRANRPVHWFLVGWLQPYLQGTNVSYGLFRPQPHQHHPCKFRIFAKNLSTPLLGTSSIFIYDTFNLVDSIISSQWQCCRSTGNLIKKKLLFQAIVTSPSTHVKIGVD